MQNRTFKCLAFLSLLTIAPLYGIDHSSFLKYITSIEDPNDAQKQIRNHVQHDKDSCLELFREAIQSGDGVAQLYCANAYYALRWDEKRDKYSYGHKQKGMDSYNFVLDPFITRGTFGRRLNDLYRKANPRATNKKVRAKRREITRRAAATGNAFAQLVLINAQRSQDYGHRFNFGQACKLYALMKADGTFPFDEAEEAFTVSLKKAAEHNELFRVTSYSELPAKLFNLFEQHDMQHVTQLIQHCKFEWQQEPEICLSITDKDQSMVRLRRIDTTDEIAIMYNYEQPIAMLTPMIEFLTDAWNRCKNDNDLAGIITDLKEHPEAFSAHKKQR